VVNEGHAFFYRNGRVLEKHRGYEESAEPPCALKGDAEGETPPFSEWSEWLGTPAPGWFWCGELKAVREALLAIGRSPKLCLKTLCTWGSLKSRCIKAVDSASGWCVIRELPQNHPELRKWCESLGVEYRGQGLPSLSLEVFESLLKGRRKAPTPKQRKDIRSKQEGKCANCGEVGDRLEFDHVCPMRQTLTVPAALQGPLQGVSPRGHGRSRWQRASGESIRAAGHRLLPELSQTARFGLPARTGRGRFASQSGDRRGQVQAFGPDSRGV
jgi:hypothetical protein